VKRKTKLAHLDASVYARWKENQPCVACGGLGWAVEQTNVCPSCKGVGDLYGGVPARNPHGHGMRGPIPPKG
jgi:hypothetical protein